MASPLYLDALLLMDILNLWGADLSSSLVMFSSSNSNFVTSGNIKGQETPKERLVSDRGLQGEWARGGRLNKYIKTDERRKVSPPRKKGKNPWKSRKCYWAREKGIDVGFLQEQSTNACEAEVMAWKGIFQSPTLVPISGNKTLP